jgi:hypothetical protein
MCWYQIWFLKNNNKNIILIHYWIKNTLKNNHTLKNTGGCAFYLRRGERSRQNSISTHVIFLFREVDFKEFGQCQVIQSLGFYFNHNNAFSISNLFSLFNETHCFIKTHFFLLVFNLVPKVLISQILADLH